MNIQVVKDFVLDKKKLKPIGWMFAAVAFVLFALFDFQMSFWYHGLFNGNGSELPSEIPYIVGAIIFIIAGGILFWCEGVKSAIAIAVAGVALLFLGHGLNPGPLPSSLILFLFLVLLYVGVVFYFKPTRLYWMVLTVGGIMTVLNLFAYLLIRSEPRPLICYFCFVIAVFQLVLAVFFVSRKFSQLEEFLLIISGKCSSLIKALGSGSGDYRFCKYYGYSVFVLGFICFAVLIFWASPGTVHLDVGKQQFETWDGGFIVSAITQLVACAIGGRFIFSQLSLAGKLRERQIKAGSAPIHLLIARLFFVTLAIFITVGAIYILCEDSNNNQNENNWATYLTLSNIPLLVSFARHSWPKLSITLASLVTIWHLVGVSFVVALVRDNIAKVLSMESGSDNKADIS